MANINQILTDWIIFAIAQATNIKADLPGLQACAQQGSKEILNAISGSVTAIFTPLATGADVAHSLALALSGSIMYQSLKTVISCAAPGIVASAAASAAIANLAKFLIPLADVWEGVQFVASVSGPLTESALSFYYWNDSQDVKVCESNGNVVACGGSFWGGTYTITSCSEPVHDIGSAQGCGYVMFPPNGNCCSTTGSLYFRSDNAENANMRWDYYVGGFTQNEVCSAETSSGPLDNASSFVYQTYTDLIGVFLQNDITFTVSTKTSNSMAGTFTGTYQYPIAGPIVNGTYPSATGTVSGTWNVSPLSAPFPKCVVPGPFWYCTGLGIAGLMSDGTGQRAQCTWIPPTDSAQSGEWQGYP